MSLKCCLQCWNTADMTFELHTLEGRSWTRSTLSEFSLTKGICYLSPVTRVPRDIPGRKFGFPRMHHLLIAFMQKQGKQWISIAMNLISIILSLVWSWSNLGKILSQTFTKDHEHFILGGPVEFLWNLNWSPVSILLICTACKLEASYLSQHIRVSMSNCRSEMNLISSRCHRSLLSVKKIKTDIWTNIFRSECCSTARVEWWVCSAAPLNFQMAAEFTLLLYSALKFW